jgi:hypothetical protein
VDDGRLGVGGASTSEVHDEEARHDLICWSGGRFSLVLRDQINRGALTPGQALPTELALGEQFVVSRITVRRALQDLADQGYVRR